MNRLRSTNPRRLAVFAIGLLALSLALIFFARDLIREILVLPLSYLFWALGVFLDTTPQIVFWLSALAIAALAAYRSLIGRLKVVPEILPDRDEIPERALNGQVALWYLRVRLMRGNPSPYFINSFHQSVNRLLMDVLGHRFHLNNNQVEERLREGSLDVPPEVRQYALHAMRRLDPAGKPLFTTLWESFTGLLKKLAGDGTGLSMARGRDEIWNRAAAPGEEPMQVVLKYIERELEVKDADPRR